MSDVQDGVKELVKMADMEPTNADLMKAMEIQNEILQAHTREDHDVALKQQKVNKVQEDVNKTVEASLASLHKWKGELKDEIREVFADELKNFFKVTGINTKTFIVGAAVIIGSLAVIGGGLKWVLGFIGFTYFIK